MSAHLRGLVKESSYGSFMLSGYDSSLLDSTTTILIPLLSSNIGTPVASLVYHFFELSGTLSSQRFVRHRFCDTSIMAHDRKLCFLRENISIVLGWDCATLLFNPGRASVVWLTDTINFTVRESATRTADYTMPYAAFGEGASILLVETDGAIQRHNVCMRTQVVSITTSIHIGRACVAFYELWGLQAICYLHGMQWRTAPLHDAYAQRSSKIEYFLAHPGHLIP